MLDIDFIRNNPDEVKEAIKQKKLEKEVDIEELLKLDENYRDHLQLVETKRSLRNRLSEDIAQISDPESRKSLIDEATTIKNDLKKLEPELETYKEALDSLLLQIPNVIHPDVPQGEDESDNVVIKTVGEKPNFNFTPKDHMELGEALDLIDTETSAKVSGARFNYLKNEAVLIQFALINFVFDTLTNPQIISRLANEADNPSAKTFVPVVPPVFVRGEVAQKMARLNPIEDRYYFPEDDLMLVGSAEHSMGPMFMDEIIDKAELPLRFIGYSTAFRREAGSYGKDTQGILRRHQFDKLEMESFTAVENGLAEQDFFIAIQEFMLNQLKIPYQVVAICTGDMGKPDYRQIDIECYMPGQGEYRETHTSDYMTDYQARRLNTRYRDEEGRIHYTHMNDATAFAVGRTLIAIFENYQQKDGSIEVPLVLRPYLGGLENISRAKIKQE